MQIYIQDRSESTVATIGDFYEDMHKTLTSTGTGSYEFTVSKSEPGQEFLNVGNYVVLLDEQNKGHQFTITKVDQLHDEKTVYAEDASLQLLSKEARPWAKVAKAQPASYYFNKALKGTGWVIGVNQITNLTRTLEWTGWDTVLTRLLSIATEFDNAELDFHVELDRTNVVRKVVDIYKQVGAYRDDIQLVYGDTANDIQKTESTENFATAIEGIGSLVENTKEGEPEKHYNFSAISYDDGDFYSPKGDPKLYSRKAHEKWDGKYGYSERHFEYETKDQQELLNRSKTELKKRCEPEVNYEISIADGRLIDINKGDTVKIFDHTYNPELLLQARAVEVDKSYTDPSQNKAIFGNFLTLISNVDPRLLEIQKQISQLPKARTPYPWVRYADDDKGTGMSMFPAGKAYMATVWNYETAVPSDNPIDYAGKWIKVKGEDGQDGSNGVPGPKGTDGKTSYFHTAYAWSADGTDRFMTVYPGENLITRTDELPDTMVGRDGLIGSYEGSALMADEITVTPGEALTFSRWGDNTNHNDSFFRYGFYTDTDMIVVRQANCEYHFTITVPANATKLKVSYPVGSQVKIERGLLPTPYIPSPLDDPEGAYPKFIGTYTDYIADDSTDPSKYNWALFKGADGSDGTPGKPGADGKTPYFHIAYADSADGTDGFYVGGGDNLLTNTGDLSANWGGAGSISTTTGYNGHPSMVFTASTQQLAHQQLGLGKLQNSTQYTASFWAKAANAGDKAHTELWGSKGATDFVLTTNWVRYTAVVTSHSDANTNIIHSRCYFGVPTGNTGNVYIAEPKLELGTTATPWSPAPSEAHPIYMGTYTDFVQADSLDPSAYTWSLIKGEDGKDGAPGSKDVPVTTVSVAQPTTAKNGDIWWVLNSAEVATAMKVYTSGAWVDKKVDQSVLNIVTLNAVTINGSTINGSEVNISYTGTLENGQQGSSQQTLDKNGYSQTSTIPWFGEPLITRSQITNTGNILVGCSNQSEYNPSQPWANTLGSIHINPINLYILFTATGLSGDYYLDVQDAYQNSGSATYLNGWGSWNADYSLKVVRKGRMVTVWGYIKHNNSATITPFAQVPAWARPQQGLVISAVTFNSKVDNPIASALVMNAETGKIGFNSGGQKGGYVCFSTTYVGGDV